MQINGQVGKTQYLHKRKANSRYYATNTSQTNYNHKYEQDIPLQRSTNVQPSFKGINFLTKQRWQAISSLPPLLFFNLNQLYDFHYQYDKFDLGATQDSLIYLSV